MRLSFGGIFSPASERNEKQTYFYPISCGQSKKTLRSFVRSRLSRITRSAPNLI